MKEKMLYMRRCDDGFEFVVQPFDVGRINDDEFLFKEAAVVILYPDGTMDAVRSSSGIHHNFYYKQLYESSMKFKEAVDSLGFTFEFEPDESTYRLDCLLASLGISSLHNVNIYNIPFRLEELERFEAVFYTFKTNNTTREMEKNLEIIYDIYPNEAIVKNQFSSETGKFERENKKDIKVM